MSVLVEAISIVVRVDAVQKKYPGGWYGFKLIIPNRTMCTDNEVIRVGFMIPDDAKLFVETLKRRSLEFLRDNEAIDMAVIDQNTGPTTKCDWLEFGHVNIVGTNSLIAVCRLVDSRIADVATPPGWKFEGSLSENSTYIPNDRLKEWKYLRTENGLDVYLNPITGKEMYVGRPFKLKYLRHENGFDVYLDPLTGEETYIGSPIQS